MYSAIAKAVHRGVDGSVHYLLSPPDGSLLIVTDPKVGVSKVPFDGPCRLMPRDPRLPVGYNAIHYESISGTESTLITVHPGRPPFENTIGGVCSSCMHGEHDFELWPVCPRDVRGDRRTMRDTEREQEPVFAPLPEEIPDRSIV
jgi:hypothetical protein